MNAGAENGQFRVQCAQGEIIDSDFGLDGQLDRLKVIRGGFASPTALRRFEHEAKLLARLHHPAIAQIYEVGEDAGTSFITMEFVEGESLASKLAAGPLDMEATVDIAIQLADALDEVHAHGISRPRPKGEDKP